MQGIDKYTTVSFASIDVKTALYVARPRVVAENLKGTTVCGWIIAVLLVEVKA